MSVQPLTWRDDAACRGLPLAMFYPDQAHGLSPQGQRAIAVCMSCRVRRDCLTEAMTPKPMLKHTRGDGFLRLGVETQGIWGGALPAQRRGDIETVLARTRLEAEERGLIPRGGRDG